MAALPLTREVRPTGAWLPGDPLGQRQFHEVGGFTCEMGGWLPRVTVAYETWGTLNQARNNAVLVEHALTGDSHVVGPAGAGHPTPGWWPRLVGPGRALDTDRYFVVCANVLGGCQGTTGPSSAAPDGQPWGSRFPRITIRDQVRAELGLADALGIEAWALVLGGSMGGMRALEWAVSHPSKVARLVVLAATAASTADEIAWAAPQLAAIEADPSFLGGDYYDQPGPGPVVGMGIARQIAHTTYRSADELQDRFGRRSQQGEDPLRDGRFAIESYLDHHADKLIHRFDANSYLALTRAMNAHDVGRDRGGVAAALARVSAKTLSLGFSSDRLYPPHLSLAIGDGVPNGQARVLHAPHGHDSFLAETERFEDDVMDLLASPVA